MSKERNYKFETLQLHVGQEQIQEQYLFIRHHLMYLETAITQQLVLDLQMQVTSMED